MPVTCPRLFSPFEFAGLRLKNRVVMAPMGTGLDADGLNNDATIEYYRRRAAGGVGMVCVEATLVDERTEGPELRLHTPEHAEGMRRLVDALRPYGAAVGVQLLHPGRQAERGPLFAPSPIALNSRAPAPRELTHDGIRDIIDRFVAAVAMAHEAGFDFVEIHGAHGYLPSDFFSPLANQRTDAYGGSVERRATFPRELVRAIIEREPDLPLIYRLSADEGLPGGISLDDATRLSAWLEEEGACSISVSAGNWRSLEVTLAPMFVERGHLVPLARRIKQAVSVPVIAVGRLDDPALAEQVLASGDADLIALGRGLIADADWATKAEAGRVAEIRPCIACNACVELVGRGGEVRCAVNPEVGREHLWRLEPATTPRRVAVIGSGPAGLEAARIARLRGHEVVIWERDTQLGGKLEVAASAPSKADVLRFREYAQRTLAALGVEVRTGTEATREALLADGADVIVVATGADPLIPPIRGVDRPHVGDAQRYLTGEADVRPGMRVVVIGGSATGCETAELLVERGADVAIVDMLPEIGQGIESITRRYLIRKLRRSGVQIVTSARVTEIERDRVVFQRNGEGGALPAERVALAVGWRSRSDGLAGQFEGREMLLAGDVERPGDFVAAVNAGADAGLRV